MWYCKIINIRWTFNFVHFVAKAIHKIRFPTKNIIHSSNIAQNFISTNSNFNKHVQCRQTAKFCAHEIKYFHSICFISVVGNYTECVYHTLCVFKTKKTLKIIRDLTLKRFTTVQFILVTKVPFCS